jgi:hypothetical protein
MHGDICRQSMPVMQIPVDKECFRKSAAPKPIPTDTNCCNGAQDVLADSSLLAGIHSRGCMLQGVQGVGREG